MSVSEVRRTVGVQVGMGMKTKLRGRLSFTRLLDIDVYLLRRKLDLGLCRPGERTGLELELWESSACR